MVAEGSGGGEAGAFLVECQPERTVFISREWAYHGMHPYGTTLGGMEPNRAGYSGDLVSDVVIVPYDDTEAVARKLADKLWNLRIMADDDGVMNRSALDLLHDSGDSIALLVVSQFTLYADCRKGRRPSYIRAAVPDVARPLVDHFANCLRALGLTVETGEFGAEMAVELVNDGPVTILLDSDELRSTV